MEKSEQVDELFGALARAQGEFEAVAFDAVNPFLRNQYATLGAVIETAKPILVKNDLAVTQLVTSQEDRVGVTTVLGHGSGQWIAETVYLSLSDEKGKSAAQVAGSVVTYLRRYALAAILGLYAEADDDGNAGGKQEEKKKEPQKPAPQQPSKTESPQPEMITLWDGKTKKVPNELIDGDTALKIKSGYIGVGKFFENDNHMKNHLHAHYNIPYDLKDNVQAVIKRLTWEQAVALRQHMRSERDDPKWYPARFGKDAEKPTTDTVVHDHESSSGYSDEYLNKIVALAASMGGKIPANVTTYAGLTNEQKADMMTLLTSSVGENKNIRADDLTTIAGVLSA